MPAHIFDKALAEQLYSNLRRANTEQAKKELFLQYLTQTFASDSAAQDLIRALAHGAERTIANIPRGARIGTGRADSQSDTVIIEWEKDLAKTGEHAKEQLRDYLVGNWKSGREYRYVLIATDGIRWRIYAPDWSHLTSPAFSLSDEFLLREIRAYNLGPETYGDFPFFLDEVLFVSTAKLASLEGIEADFGDTSATFINSMRALKECERHLKESSELRTAFEEWKKFLSIAYGRSDHTPTMFMVHTYLSVFAKFLAFAVVGHRSIHDDKTIKGVLSGVLFEQELLVERFVEDDFFHWVTGADYFPLLKPMFRELNRQISEYDFSSVHEDILKGVYQELIDLDTRHALGEYYTPDWLCERVIAQVPLTVDSRVLDPACGSGSFLRAAIARLRKEHPKITAEKLASQIVGIDIHPLSVQIAKTTVLLSLGGLLAKARKPITLHIYLANSLLVPAEKADLLQSTFTVSIDNRGYALNVSGLLTQGEFDQLITVCDDLAGRYKEPMTQTRFSSLAAHALPSQHSPGLPRQLYDVYRALKRARDEGRDSIWKFILQNTYKPVFLKNKFDLVVGNPPWLTYSSVTNADYQAELRGLADEYRVTPEHKANMPHMEIAAIFLAHSINYFAKPSGMLAFVLPRSFMSADQHENTRAGVVTGLQIREIWDLNGVAPLFRVPTCVFFAVKKDGTDPITYAGLNGLSITGKLPKAHLHWAEASRGIVERPVKWFYSRLNGGNQRSRSAFTDTELESPIGKNPYAELFKQGATLVPRTFCFVETVNDEAGGAYEGRVLTVRTLSAVLPEAKPPWKELTLSGQIEGDFLFRSALSRNVLPFVFVSPLIVALPIVIEQVTNGRHFVMVDSELLTKRGARLASKWFWEATRLWDENKTEAAVRSKMSYLRRLDFQHGVTEQNPDDRFLVLYTSSATDASAVVVDKQAFDRPFIASDTSYWCAFDTARHAHYVCAYINSGYANEKIKEFQARGLFGARHIHKTIIKLPFPKFEPKNEQHLALAALGEKCASLAPKALVGRRIEELDARSLGRLRSKIRDQLAEHLAEIDVLVERLSTGKSEAAIRAAGRGVRRRRSYTAGLFE